MSKEKPWHEQDEFWRVAGPVLFAKRRIEDAVNHVEKIIALFDLKPGMKVLDLCCGVGRHSLEFARRGFHVTGVDRTKSYLDTASKRAKAEGLDIEFVLEDMRKFSRKPEFDLVINLYTSFGYFEDPAEDRLVALNMSESLKEGGIFLLEMASKEVNARVFRERDWNEVDDLIILEERKVLDNWSRMGMHWIILKGNRREDINLSVRLYSASELVSLLSGCGFRQCDVYSDFEGSPYDHKAKRLLVAARK
jgi:SAM-dependent methyltransferase